jgi:hypothetical protein
MVGKNEILLKNKSLIKKREGGIFWFSGFFKKIDEDVDERVREREFFLFSGFFKKIDKPNVEDNEDEFLWIF